MLLSRSVFSSISIARNYLRMLLLSHVQLPITVWKAQMRGRGNWHGARLPQRSGVMVCLSAILCSYGPFFDSSWEIKEIYCTFSVFIFRLSFLMSAGSNHFKSTARKNTNLHFVHLRKELPMNILVLGTQSQSFTLPALSDLLFGFFVSEISSTVGC